MRKLRILLLLLSLATLVFPCTCVASMDGPFVDDEQRKQAAVLERLAARGKNIEVRSGGRPVANVLKSITGYTKTNLRWEGDPPEHIVAVDLTETLEVVLLMLAEECGLEYDVPDRRTLVVRTALRRREEMIPSRIMHRVPPEYPGSRVRGEVKLLFIVEKDGTVGDVTVLEGVPKWPQLEKSATDAVKKWRYRPALQNGRPVATYMTAVVRFNLSR